MSARFTIDDVKQWMGCSGEAGKLVWLDSNFYKAIIYKAPEKDIGWLCYELGKDFEAQGYYLVWELQKRMKTRYQEDEGFRFTKLEEFISYVKKAIAGSLKDIAKKIYLTRSHEVPDNEGNIERHPEGEPIADYGDVDNILRYIAVRIVDGFAAYHGLTPSQKSFLAKMTRCSASIGNSELGLIAMLQNRHDHLGFLSEMRNLVGDEFNQNTYNSNVLRLTASWRQYIESEEGASLYEEFEGVYLSCFQ